MSYENVKLWFAKNENERITTIDEINGDNKHNSYSCPVCGSQLKPKATTSVRMTSHFAHVDASKCSSESMIHWWFKHKFIEKGDLFKVKSDAEKTYVCKDILVEKTYHTSDADYKPDVTVITECGNTIYFEMAFTNRKKVRDYLDIWIELKNIVVEIDITSLMMVNEVLSFKALFYNDKCFNTKRNDTYYNTIGRYKEEKLNGEVNEDLKERIRKLDWFWDDVFRYKKDEVDIKHMVMLIDSINSNEKNIVQSILRKNICSGIMDDYYDYKTSEWYNPIFEFIEKEYGEYYANNNIDKTKESDFKFIIKIYDKSAGMWYSYDILDYDIDNLISLAEKYISSNKLIDYYNTKIAEYNKKVKTLKRRISSTKKYREYKIHVKEVRGNYLVDYNVKGIDYYTRNFGFDFHDKENFNFENFNIEFTLYYDEFKVCETLIVVNEGIDIKNICEQVIKKFDEYFNNINFLNNIDEIEAMENYLNDYYSELNVEIFGCVATEEIYCIGAISRYHDKKSVERWYICNDGVLSNSKTKYADDITIQELDLSTNDLSIINKYLIEKIESKIKNDVKFRCRDCCNNFTISFGEIKFFTEKSFTLPKRCKCCRIERKKNNN